MAFLIIKGKEGNDREFHAKTNFAFERVANEKYSEKTPEGEELGGFMSIYLGLLQFDNLAISHFWDCALTHYKKDKPTLEQIEAALEARIEEDGGTDKVLKEAFQVLDNAGFFKKQVKSIWQELKASEEPKENESDEERKARQESEKMAKMMQNRYNELTEPTTIVS